MVKQGFEDISGRYLNVPVRGRDQRIYVEEAGSGIPLLCLHTAGSDGRQYRHLLNDEEVTRRFRVIAFDLPSHGKSAAPDGFQNERYQLTADAYVDTIMAVVRAMRLDRPVVMGCSIGGRVVLHLLIRHASEFRAAIGLQTTRKVAGRLTTIQNALQYLHRPDVHGGEAAAGLLTGIMAPQSPAAGRWQTLWYYMQSGPGVFLGDACFYKDSGNLDAEQLRAIDTARTPLYLLTGEYDYSATPDATREVQRLVPGSKFTLMSRLGHFPMSENYAHFRSYLLPVLQELAAAGLAAGTPRPALAAG